MRQFGGIWSIMVNQFSRGPIRAEVTPTAKFRRLSTVSISALTICLAVSCTTLDSTDSSPREKFNDTLLRAATNSEQQKNHSTALSYYLSLYEREPENIEAILGASRSFRQLGRSKEAHGILLRPLRRNPLNPALRLEYAKVALTTGTPGKAIEILENLSAENKTEWEVHALLGIAHDRLGQFDESSRAYEQALNLNPGDMSLLNNYALSYVQADKPENALALLEEAASLPGATIQVRQNLAMVYAMTGDLDSARRLILRDLPAADAEANLKYYARLAEQSAARRRVSDAVERSEKRKVAVAPLTVDAVAAKRQVTEISVRPEPSAEIETHLLPAPAAMPSGGVNAINVPNMARYDGVDANVATMGKRPLVRTLYKTPQGAITTVKARTKRSGVKMPVDSPGSATPSQHNGSDLALLPENKQSQSNADISSIISGFSDVVGYFDKYFMIPAKAVAAAVVTPRVAVLNPRPAVTATVKTVVQPKKADGNVYEKKVIAEFARLDSALFTANTPSADPLPTDTPAIEPLVAAAADKVGSQAQLQESGGQPEQKVSVSTPKLAIAGQLANLDPAAGPNRQNDYSKVAKGFRVQVGSFKTSAKARKWALELSNRYDHIFEGLNLNVITNYGKNNIVRHRVMSDLMLEAGAAESVCHSLNKQGTDCLIVELVF